LEWDPRIRRQPSENKTTGEGGRGSYIIIAGLLLSSIWLASAQDVPHPTGVLLGHVVDDEGRPMRKVEV
jgi:hypothetical protein